MIASLQVGDLEGFRDKDEKVFRNLTETIYTDVPDHKPVWEAIVRLPEVCEPCASISEEKGSIAFPGSPSIDGQNTLSVVPVFQKENESNPNLGKPHADQNQVPNEQSSIMCGAVVTLRNQNHATPNCCYSDYS